MNIDQAKAFLVEVNNKEFKDKTYKDYIETRLAGDFSVELAKYIKSLKERVENAENDLGHLLKS